MPDSETFLKASREAVETARLKRSELNREAQEMVNENSIEGEEYRELVNRIDELDDSIRRHEGRWARQ